jgi:hypothetical protein
VGRTIVLVFYSPNSKSASELLHFAESLCSAFGKRVQVVGLSVSEERAPILEQKKQFRLSFPILAGQGLRLTYLVEATPKLVVIDPAGVVRGSYVGWGPETPELVVTEVRHWSPDPPSGTGEKNK